MSVISVHLVIDIAFIFHADVLEHELVNCAGMVRVFFTRYKYDGNDNLLTVHNFQFKPFANIESYDSFPSRIWFPS